MKDKPKGITRRQPKGFTDRDFNGKFEPREKPKEAGAPKKGRTPLFQERRKPVLKGEYND